MKFKIIFMILCSVLIITGCHKSQDVMKGIEENSDFMNSNDSVPDTSIIFNNLELKIPSPWLIYGNTMYYKKRPVLKVEINSYDEEQLKKAFYYQNTEECVMSFLPNGVYLKNDNATIKEINGLQVYEFECTADKYSVSEEAFIKSDDLVYLDYIIQQNKIYCLYFMNDMADINKMDEFLNKMQSIKFDIKEDGQYRWMIAN